MLLVHAAERWQRSGTGGESVLPCTSKERVAFKELINGMRRQHDGVPIDVRVGGEGEGHPRPLPLTWVVFLCCRDRGCGVYLPVWLRLP